MTVPLLAARALEKSFAGVRALTALSFDLAAGQVHALVGENGAGKSTFVRIVTGAETADAGTLEIDGDRVVFGAPAEARARGIAAIYQHPALFPDLTVAENIRLPVEQGRPWTRVAWRQREEAARAILERLGAEIDPRRTVETLSLPEQQIVEIAKAVGADARMLLMDEPTAALADREVDRLFAVVDRLRVAGTGIIYISHRLEEIARIADRVTVIRDGCTVAAGLPPTTPSTEIIRLMVGREVEVLPRVGASEPGEVALAVRHLSSRAAGLHDVSFDVGRGEVVGLAGLVGSGRTELAEALFGLRPIDHGDVHVSGARYEPQSPEAAIAAGLAYLPEDRRRHGVVGELGVAANMTLASLGRFARAGLLRPAAEAAAADDYVHRFAIRAPSTRTAVGDLSGGNQQKVALARWLMTEPAVLMLDEPTQGVDVGAKAEIHRLIGQLAAEGRAVLLISSDLPEVLALSDRVMVMRRGTVGGTLARTDATPEAVLALALGHGEAERARMHG